MKSALDHDTNWHLLGITEDSLSLGKAHSKGLYNAVMTRILLNRDESTAEAKTAAAEACNKLVKRIALVDIELTEHDALVKTKKRGWDLEIILANIGNHQQIYVPSYRVPQ